MAPYYCYNENQEHVLGIGSVLFMATPASHVWGSGILDPRNSYDRIFPAHVHAVRGTHTRDILRRSDILRRDIPLGDPAIFANEIPEIRACLARGVAARRRVAIIPHYTRVDHPYVLALARELDAQILSPRTASLDFLEELIASEVVISESLHGLIFAELFGKPSAWISESSDAVWAFKFHDWYSTTHDKPAGPLLFGTRPAEVRQAARLSGLNIDREALRCALPTLGMAEGGPAQTLDFRQSRLHAPLQIAIVAEAATILDTGRIRTVVCRGQDEEALRRRLNRIAREFDELVPALLIFDRDAYETLSLADIARAQDMLTSDPKAHFVAIAPRSCSDAPTLNAAWRGVVLTRHLIDFSFSACGTRLH